MLLCACYGVDVDSPGSGADVAGGAGDAGVHETTDAGPRDVGPATDSAVTADVSLPADVQVESGDGASDGGPLDFDGGTPDAGQDSGADSGGGADAGVEDSGGFDVGEDGGTVVIDAGADGGCKPPIVFERPEQFIPTVAAPVLHVPIQMQDGLVFGKVELEIDFVRGPWSTVPPGPDRGMSNVFWLHRGTKANHWLGNLVGYMNFKSKATLEASANLGITDPQVWKQAISKRVPTVEGDSYHAQFAYDAAGGKMWFRAFHAGSEIAYAETVPLVTEIVGWDVFKGGEPGFFVEIGFADGGGGTVEIPTYDWVYSNLVVRFFFLDGGCP